MVGVLAVQNAMSSPASAIFFIGAARKCRHGRRHFHFHGQSHGGLEMKRGNRDGFDFTGSMASSSIKRLTF